MSNLYPSLNQYLFVLSASHVKWGFVFVSYVIVMHWWHLGHIINSIDVSHGLIERKKLWGSKLIVYVIMMTHFYDITSNNNILNVDQESENVFLTRKKNSFFRNIAPIFAGFKASTSASSMTFNTPYQLLTVMNTFPLFLIFTYTLWNLLIYSIIPSNF